MANIDVYKEGTQDHVGHGSGIGLPYFISVVNSLGDEVGTAQNNGKIAVAHGVARIFDENSNLIAEINVTPEITEDFSVSTGAGNGTINISRSDNSLIITTQNDVVINNSTGDILDQNGLVVGNFSVKADSVENLNIVIPTSTIHIEDTDGNVLYQGSFTGYPPINEVVSCGNSSLPIGYIRPKNFATSTIRDGDDGWLAVNMPDAYQPTPATHEIAAQDPNNWFLLLTDNRFGSKHRFTSKNGGFYDFATSQWKDVNGNVTTFATEFGNEAGKGYVLDNLTNYGYINKRMGSKTFAAAHTAIQGYNSGAGFLGFNTGWKMMSKPLFEGLFDRNVQAGANIPVINPYFTFDQNGWLSTSYNADRSMRFTAGTLLISQGTVTNNSNQYMCRIHD